MNKENKQKKREAEQEAEREARDREFKRRGNICLAVIVGAFVLMLVVGRLNAGAAWLGGFFTAMGGSGATLSVALYIYAMERGKFDVAFAVAAVLMLIVLIVNFAAKRLGRRLKNNQ